MTSKIVFVLFVGLLAVAWADSRLDLVLSARDLPDMDICCSPGVFPPDVYAIVYYSPNNFDPYQEHGRTRVLSDNNNPDWSDIFAFNAIENSSQRLKIDIWDSDVDADDYIGSIEFTFQDILTTFGYTLQKDLSPSGNGYMRVVGRINGTTSQESVFERPGKQFHSYAVPLQHATIKEMAT